MKSIALGKETFGLPEYDKRAFTSFIRWKENPMLCTVIDIRGDYAIVKYQDTGVISEVAIALLPFGVDIGNQLKFEDFEFTIVR